MYSDISPRHIKTIPFKNKINTAIIADADAFKRHGSFKISCSTMIKRPKKPAKKVVKKVVKKLVKKTVKKAVRKPVKKAVKKVVKKVVKKTVKKVAKKK